MKVQRGKESEEQGRGEGEDKIAYKLMEGIGGEAHGRGRIGSEGEEEDGRKPMKGRREGNGRENKDI